MNLGNVCKTAMAASVLACAAMAQNVVTDWNQIALQTIVLNAGKSGFDAPAYFAYTGVAMFDAANSIDHRFKSFAVSVDAPAGASVDAAVVTAAHDVLAHYFPLQQSSLDAAETASLQALGASNRVTDGANVGHQVAARWIMLRANDGLQAPITFTPGHGPGIWELVPPFTVPGGPWLQYFRPFTMTSNLQFLSSIDPPPALNSDLWARDYNTVKAWGSLTGSLRTPEQTETGVFWTAHPSLQYLPAVTGLIIQQHLTVSDAARLQAEVSVGLADAITACVSLKYHYAFWRPYTAIRAGSTDGNSATVEDATWLPLAPTPPHPEYPAAHGCVSQALASTLTAFFGTDHLPLTVFSGATQTTHHYATFSALVAEVDAARIYGGMHYPHSTLQGNKLGRLVVQQMLANYFKP